MSRKNAKRDAQRRKAIGRAPVWLKTVQIAKSGKKARERGSFGAASECVSIEPATGLPRTDSSANDTHPSPQENAA